MKTYLGDGAYAEFNSYGELVLTTSNGISDTNRIVLGVDEVFALLTFGERNVPAIANFIAHAIARAEALAR